MNNGDELVDMAPDAVEAYHEHYLANFQSIGKSRTRIRAGEFPGCGLIVDCHFDRAQRHLAAIVRMIESTTTTAKIGSLNHRIAADLEMASAMMMQARRGKHREN